MSVSTAQVQAFHQRAFCLRPGEAPALARASGDSGFVAHLSACTRGATGWDWSFRLTKKGGDWAFASDGRLSLYLDEPGQYVPADALVGEAVAVRLPRARENLFPHRFALHGGQGGPVLAGGVVKFFLPVTFEAAPALVGAFAGRGGDQLHFALMVSNHPLDFDRADAAVVDVGTQDEPGVLKLLEHFIHTHPRALWPRGLPYATQTGPLGVPRAVGNGRQDLADGYGWRRAQEAVARGGVGGA
ncbi:MAG: hypothetical protein HY828_10330 [Actinobacteria bacterium]|nr:hypothetical protein [Actinomycetota bacterium]